VTGTGCVAGVPFFRRRAFARWHLPGGDGAYYSVDGYPLRDGFAPRSASTARSSEGVRDSSAFVGLFMLLQPYRSLRASP
jgi:hypothetical protein